jgi:hypothetical protein
MQSEILFPAKSRKQPTAVARVPISSNNRLAHRARMECAQLLREPQIAVAPELLRQIGTTLLSVTFRTDLVHSHYDTS